MRCRLGAHAVERQDTRQGFTVFKPACSREGTAGWQTLRQDRGRADALHCAKEDQPPTPTRALRQEPSLPVPISGRFCSQLQSSGSAQGSRRPTRVARRRAMPIAQCRASVRLRSARALPLPAAPPTTTAHHPCLRQAAAAQNQQRHRNMRLLTPRRSTHRMRPKWSKGHSPAPRDAAVARPHKLYNLQRKSKVFFKPLA